MSVKAPASVALVSALFFRASVTWAASVQATVDPTELYLGETTVLNIQVADFAAGMEPDLSRLKGEVAFLGQQDESRQNITIINGKPQITGFSGRRFQYRFTPTQTGRQQLGDIRVIQNGRVVATTPGPTLSVRPIPQQDHVVLFVETPKSRVIIDEPFTVTLRILVRRLQPPYAEASPIAEQAPPFLSIPYLDQAEDSGLATENIEERLNQMLVNGRDPGFRINRYTLGNGMPFGGFFGNERQARFGFERHAVTHNGSPYFEYRFPVTFTPEREGRYNFGPAVFKGRVFVNVTPNGEGQTETIYAIAEAITVQATPPPIENRPDSYIGAIGSNLTVKASFDAQTCYIGDPLTLTVEIRGPVRFEAITAPRLGTQPELKKNFRIYEDTVKRESGDDYSRYRFTVRPSRTGTIEFPPVAISYYNTLDADYRTLYTEPIPLRVNAVTQVERDMVIDTGSQSITIQDTAAQQKTAPVLMQHPLTLAESFFFPRLHLPLLLIGPLCYLIVLLLRVCRQFLPTWRNHRVRQSAAAKAIRQLDAIQQRLAHPHNNTGSVHHPGGRDAVEAVPGDPESHDDVGALLRSYLTARFSSSFRAVTADECQALLRSHAIDADLAQRVADILDACAAAAFSNPGQSFAGTTDLCNRTATLISELESAMKEKRKKQPKSDTAMIVIGLALLSCTPRCDANAANDFDARWANALLTQAAQPDDFSKAAEALAALIDNGAANATLFYNYGTALLLAGQPDLALRALARAERYSGTTWNIRRNMLLALREQDQNASLPWQRIPLFWHYRLSATARLTIASLAFCAFWLLLVISPSKLGKQLQPLLWITIAAGLLFGTSFFSSWLAENEAIIEHSQRHAIREPLTEENA